MPCIFLENIEADVQFKAPLVRQLYEEIARVVGCDPNDVELHVRVDRYDVYGAEGFLVFDHGVHGFVEWHAGRTLEMKRKVAQAIHLFLVAHDMGRGSDITFRDSPVGETFFVEGELVT